MEIIVIASSFSAVSTFFVVLRLFTRLYLIKNPGIDDYIIVAAMCFAWCSFGFLIQEVHYGVGQPTASLSGEEIKLQLKALWLSIPFYNMSLTLTKASIVFLYLRIFVTPKFILAARIVLGVIVVYGLWTVISAFLNCLPINSFWDTSIPGHCIPKAFLWYFNGGLNIATDLAVLILPVPVLSHLRLPRRQKFGVILIFATGGFTCVTSMIRLNYLTIATHSLDPIKDNGPIATWSQIELNMGIICSCLPPLQPLVTRILPRLLDSVSRPRGPDSATDTGRNTDRISGRKKRIYCVDEVTITQELRMETSDREIVSDTGSDRRLVLNSKK